MFLPYADVDEPNCCALVVELVGGWHQELVCVTKLQRTFAVTCLSTAALAQAAAAQLHLARMVCSYSTTEQFRLQAPHHMSGSGSVVQGNCLHVNVLLSCAGLPLWQ